MNLNKYISKLVKPYGYMVFKRAVLKPSVLVEILALDMSSASRRKMSEIYFDNGRKRYRRIIEWLLKQK